MDTMNITELDQKNSSQLNDYARFLTKMYQMPTDLLTEYIVKFDNLDERNAQITFACFAMHLLSQGTPIEKLQEEVGKQENYTAFLDRTVALHELSKLVDKVRREVKKMRQVYVAGPWFSVEQEERLEGIKDLLRNNNIPFYSPKDECLFTNIIEMDPCKVLQTNCDAIVESEFVLAITDGKDVGTMWECGYAYAMGTPILYVWLTHEKGQKFNLMLAASGAVAYTHNQIMEQIGHYEGVHRFMPGKFDGAIE